MKTFYFNTGVKQGVNPYLDITATARPKKDGGYVMHIPFECEDVPESATFVFACDNPNLENHPDKIVREIFNSKLISKYAYFKIK